MFQRTISCGLGLRKCVLALSFFDAALASAGVVANIVAFTYYLTTCHYTGFAKIAGTQDTNYCFLYPEFVPNVNVSNAPKFAALFLIYNAVHLYVAFLLFQASRESSHEKCRWAFMISIVLWLVGTGIFIVILEHYVMIYAYIIIYTFKIYEIYVTKKFMDELHAQGMDR